MFEVWVKRGLQDGHEDLVHVSEAGFHALQDCNAFEDGLVNLIDSVTVGKPYKLRKCQLLSFQLGPLV